MNTALIELPASETLGPAMQELTELQRRFVLAYLEGGGRSAKAAAVSAGYGGGTHACEVRGFEAMRNPKVLKAMREEADKRLRSGALLAASGLIEIAQDTHHRDRFKAIESLLNRAGLIVQTQHKVVIEDTRTEAEVIERVGALATQLGLDPRSVLKSVGVVIDGEFSEVKPEETLDDFFGPATEDENDDGEAE
jgi:phage terminase small subunit